jgi:hypothetical protein
MGTEYRISCPPQRFPEIGEFLRSSGGESASGDLSRFEFRFSQERSGGMPDATVALQPTGIYFCDNGGSRERVAVLFRRLIDRALTHADSSDSVVITSL